METWQIRERGTNKVLKEFEAVAVYIDGSGSFCVAQENGAKNPDVEGFKFNLILHYISRKGEVLVSEEDHEAMQFHKAQYEAIGSYAGNLSGENAALKAELAELKSQKEPLGINDPSFEGACVRAEQKILDRAKASEPEKEVESTRGDEIAKVIEEMIDHAIAADRANHIDVACDCWDDFAEHKTKLAALINQGV